MKDIKKQIAQDVLSADSFLEEHTQSELIEANKILVAKCNQCALWPKAGLSQEEVYDWAMTTLVETVGMSLQEISLLFLDEIVKMDQEMGLYGDGYEAIED